MALNWIICVQQWLIHVGKWTLRLRWALSGTQGMCTDLSAFIMKWRNDGTELKQLPENFWQYFPDSWPVWPGHSRSITPCRSPANWSDCARGISFNVTMGVDPGRGLYVPILWPVAITPRDNLKSKASKCRKDMAAVQKVVLHSPTLIAPLSPSFPLPAPN